MIEYQKTGKRIKLNHSGAIPRYIIAYHTQTDRKRTDDKGSYFAHTFARGVAIATRMKGTDPTGNSVHHLDNTEGFWKLLEEKTAANYTTWVVCHNALYDLIVSGFTERFERGELAIEWPRSRRKTAKDGETPKARGTLTVIENPPTILACRLAATGGRIVFVDIANWFDSTLEDLAAAIGTVRLSSSLQGIEDDERFQACQRDAEIVAVTFVSLVQWVKANNFGMFRYTSSSQAMAAYRHRFKSADILVHDNVQVKAIERAGYFGGRTELFYIGRIRDTVYQLDTNSLYPSVMSSQKYPICLNRYEMRKECVSDKPQIDWRASIAEVTLDTDEPIYPVRTKRGVTYPIGQFRTVLCGPELAYAASRLHITAVGSWAEYRLADLFSEFVAHLWQMRQEYKSAGNLLYDKFTKRIMNGLYGKFAQLSAKWEDVPGDLSSLPWAKWWKPCQRTGKRIYFRSVGWQVQRDCGKAELDSTFVAISAFVTSYGRMKMNGLRNIAGVGNVLYQGADSLVVNRRGRMLLAINDAIRPTELGGLRQELETDDGEIIGNSDYRLGDKVVAAGYSNAAEVEYHGKVMQSRYYAATELFSGSSNSQLTETLEPWVRQSEYLKGTIRPDGFVDPLVLSAD